MNDFIITERDSGFIIELAAKELRRYLYVLEIGIYRRLASPQLVRDEVKRLKELI